MTEPLKSTESLTAGDDTGRDAPAAHGQPQEPAGADSPDPREPLGRLVHEVRCSFGAALDRPMTPAPWEERHPRQQELDMQIGEAVAAAGRERLRAVLAEHYLAGITCDHAQERDNPVCGCSLVFLGWHPSLGAAVEAWADHVAEVLGSEEGGGHG